MVCEPLFLMSLSAEQPAFCQKRFDLWHTVHRCFSRDVENHMASLYDHCRNPKRLTIAGSLEVCDEKVKTPGKIGLTISVLSMQQERAVFYATTREGFWQVSEVDFTLHMQGDSASQNSACWKGCLGNLRYLGLENHELKAKNRVMLTCF